MGVLAASTAAAGLGLIRMGSAGRSLILEHVWTTKIYAVGHGVATQGLVIQAERVANLVDRYPAFFRAVSHPFRDCLLYTSDAADE